MWMSYEFWFSTFIYAGTAGIALFSLVSGLAPLSGRDAIRRERRSATGSNCSSSRQCGRWPPC